MTPQPAAKALSVLFVSETADWGGSEVAVARIANGMADRGQVSVVAGSPENAVRFKDGGCSSVEVVRAGLPLVVKLRQYLVLLRKKRPDIVHVNMTGPLSCLAPQIVCAFFPRIKVVVQEHVTREEGLDGASRVKLLARRLLKRALSRSCDAHVVVSRRGVEDLVEEFGLRQSKMTVVENGVPVPASTGNVLTSRSGEILAAGRFVYQKGFDVLLDAMQHVPNCRLTLVGARTENELGSMQGLVDGRGLEDRVAVCMWSSNPVDLFRPGAIFVLSSRWEVAPLIPLEMMAAGAVVVSTDVGNMREVLSRVDERLIVDVDDSRGLGERLNWLMESPDEKRRLEECSLSLARTSYSIEENVNRLSRIYMRVTGRTADVVLRS